MHIEARVYTIVVVGAMNPRIHHPRWYKYIDVLTDEEYTSAVNSQDFVVTPPIAQFTSSRFWIQCQESRWEVGTRNEEFRERLLDITFKTFDEALAHTPVSALGLNFTYLLTTEVPGVGERLAQLLHGTPLSLPSGDKQMAKVEHVDVLHNHKWTIRIEEGNQSPSSVIVAHNFHYQMPTEDRFFLKDSIHDSYHSIHEKSLQQTYEIVESLKGE